MELPNFSDKRDDFDFTPKLPQLSLRDREILFKKILNYPLSRLVDSTENLLAVTLGEAEKLEYRKHLKDFSIPLLEEKYRFQIGLYAIGFYQLALVIYNENIKLFCSDIDMIISSLVSGIDSSYISEFKFQYIMEKVKAEIATGYFPDKLDYQGYFLTHRNDIRAFYTKISKKNFLFDEIYIEYLRRLSIVERGYSLSLMTLTDDELAEKRQLNDNIFNALAYHYPFIHHDFHAIIHSRDMLKNIKEFALKQLINSTEILLEKPRKRFSRGAGKEAYHFCLDNLAIDLLNRDSRGKYNYLISVYAMGFYNLAYFAYLEREKIILTPKCIDNILKILVEIYSDTGLYLNKRRRIVNFSIVLSELENTLKREASSAKKPKQWTIAEMSKIVKEIEMSKVPVNFEDFESSLKDIFYSISDTDPKNLGMYQMDLLMLRNLQLEEGKKNPFDIFGKK